MKTSSIKYNSAKWLAGLDQFLGGPIRAAIDAKAMVQLQSLTPHYLPIGSSALRPSGLCVIANDVFLNRRKQLMEFGAGVSTIVLATCAKRFGGSVLSFESDKKWIAYIESLLSSYGLEQCVEIVHAPLKNDNGETWYDTGEVKRSIGDRTFDFVLVDGPPAFKPQWEFRRRQALNYVEKHLEENAVIYLDDINRPGEYEIFLQWCKQLEVEGIVDYLGGDLGVITLGESYHPFI